MEPTASVEIQLTEEEREQKVSTVVDHNGVTISTVFTPANKSDYVLLDDTLNACLEPLQTQLGDANFIDNHSC